MADAATYGRLVSRSKTKPVDWLRRSALAGVCLDAATTWHVLAASGYRELNPILAVLWTVDPAVIAGYFGGFFGLVWLTTRRRNWLSTTISTAVFVVVGVFGGLNNLALFVFGPPSLIEQLATAVGLPPSTLIVSVLPVCGLAVALVVARLRHGRLRWRRVLAVVAGGSVGYFVYLRAVELAVDVPVAL